MPPQNMKKAMVFKVASSFRFVWLLLRIVYGMLGKDQPPKHARPRQMDIPAKIESHGPPFPFRLTSIEL